MITVSMEDVSSVPSEAETLPIIKRLGMKEVTTQGDLGLTGVTHRSDRPRSGMSRRGVRPSPSEPANGHPEPNNLGIYGHAFPTALCGRTASNILRGMRKEELVNRLNDVLEMDHRLSVWQFQQVRKYELEEMVMKVERLYALAHGQPYEPRTYMESRHHRSGLSYRS